jgi:hypothetical protein
MSEEHLVDDWCFELGFDNEGWLGKGEWGNAYHVSEDKVIKITRDYEEFICAFHLLNKDTQHNVKIHEMRVFPNGELGILMDHANTEGIEDTFRELLGFADDNELDILDIDPAKHKGNISDDALKMSNDLYLAWQEIANSGYSGAHSLDIQDGNIGINYDGNYVLFDQRDKSNPFFDDHETFNEIKQKLKDNYLIDEDRIESKIIPINKILVSENAISRTLADLKNKRYSQTDEPIECMFNENGKLQITDGYHRFCEALLVNKENVEVNIVYDERCGYPNQTYANIKNEDALYVDHDLSYSGLENIADSAYLDDLFEEYDSYNSIDLKVISFDEVFHTGTLDKSNKSPTSLEGINGISISNNSSAWNKINSTINGDTFKFTKDNNLFLNVSSLSDKTKKLINEWAVNNSYFEKISKYKHEYYDEDLDVDNIIEFDSLDEALEEHNIEELTKFFTYKETDKFSNIVGNNNKWNTELILSVYTNEMTEFDGIFWDEPLNAEEYSAPRGTIFEDKISSWSKVNLNKKLLNNLDSFVNTKNHNNKNIADDIKKNKP